MKTNFKEFLNENVSAATITITPDQSNYDVTYEIDDIEIDGTLIKNFDGRADFFEFEPGFLDDDAQEYYDENYEEIEDEILYQLDNPEKVDKIKKYDV